MMTVRFPNGQAIQYNNACFLSHENGFSIIYADYNKEKFIAQIPIDCIVEFVNPCRVYNPISNVPNESFDELKKEVQALKRKLYRMK
jgi:hypothetical protein